MVTKRLLALRIDIEALEARHANLVKKKHVKVREDKHLGGPSKDILDRLSLSQSKRTSLASAIPGQHSS